MEKGLLTKGPSNEYSIEDQSFAEYVGRIRGINGEGLQLSIHDVQSRALLEYLEYYWLGF